MNRLSTHLAALRSKRERALALFFTCGFPELDSTVQVARTAASAGADILEIGMPFSDPLADGPVIQQSSARALRNGMTLPLLLEQVREIRRALVLPIVLMGYVNPILRFGERRFFREAANAGVDGVILPEVPLEESRLFRESMRSAGLAQILLVTPTTPDARVREIDSASEGFVYCVSTTGVTGGEVGGEAVRHVKRIRAGVTRNPLLVGFGVSTAEQASELSRDADGVIVGSAFLRRLQDGQSDVEIADWIGGLKSAMQGRI